VGFRAEKSYGQGERLTAGKRGTSKLKEKVHGKPTSMTCNTLSQSLKDCKHHTKAADASKRKKIDLGKKTLTCLTISR